VDRDRGIDDGTPGSRAKFIGNYSQRRYFDGCQQGVDWLSVSGTYLTLNEKSLTSKNAEVTAMSLVEPEAETADTYRWRGDCGLLDRLAYRDSRSIPNGWKDTTIDPLKIQQSQLSSHRLEGLRPDSIEWCVNTVDSVYTREPHTLEAQKPETGSMIEGVIEQTIERPKKRFSSTHPFSK
jgi:hypothetical protein